MATAKQIIETEEKVVRTEVKRIQLDLTPDEAETLVMVCNMVRGPHSGRRRDMYGIHCALFGAGARGPKSGYAEHGLVEFNNSAIYFTDKRHPDGHE